VIVKNAEKVGKKKKKKKAKSKKTVIVALGRFFDF
jgi:hypothetical protein